MPPDARAGRAVALLTASSAFAGAGGDVPIGRGAPGLGRGRVGCADSAPASLADRGAEVVSHCAFTR